MLYTTYRPRTISELDNSNVKDILARILESKSLPHAFLFVGQKGMGKTSTARIFAKAINCLENKFAEKGSSIEPCNKCDICRSIDVGSSPDVIEQDAGARGLKEEMLDLIKETAFAPIVCRFRIFILDEAHMISPAAFNALLKTLEEPPPHVKFIFATTNEEKVPKTIASRCMRVNFGRATKADIIHMLTRITKTEKREVPEDVLAFLAENADYSFRDATKMLEEVFMHNKVTLEDAQKYFGMRSKYSFLKAIEMQKLEEVIVWLHQFTESGGNSKLLLEETLRTLEEMLMKKSGVPIEEVPDTTLTVRQIGHLMKLFTEAYTFMRTAPIEIIPLEIAVVEFYNERKL